MKLRSIMWSQTVKQRSQKQIVANEYIEKQKLNTRLPIASTQTLGMSQTPPAGERFVSLLSGLCDHSHQLQLLSTLTKNTHKQTWNSARMYSLAGNNNRMVRWEEES